MTGIRVAFFLVFALSMAPGVMAEETGADLGPVSGVLVDTSARSIRPIVGMPGSAYAGHATVTSFDFATAAPGSQHAVVAREGIVYLLRRLNAGRPVWRELTSEIAEIEFAAWSDNAEAVVLRPRNEARLDFWATLSYDPKKKGSVDLSALDERIESIAVDPDGKFAFASTQGEKSGTLYYLKPGELPRMLMPLDRAGALLLRGDSLWVTDRGRSEVFRLRNWDQMPQIQSAATLAHGIEDPVGVALSRDGKWLWVASAAARHVVGLDLGASQVKHVLDLDFTPTRMHRLGVEGLFLLEVGIPGESPAQVLDTGSRRVFFVPVSAAAD